MNFRVLVTVAALLSACTEPEVAPSVDGEAEQASMVATSVDSSVGNGELPVVVVSADRPLPEIVVTASRPVRTASGRTG